jgi:hypothetical protein
MTNEQLRKDQGILTTKMGKTVGQICNKAKKKQTRQYSYFILPNLTHGTTVPKEVNQKNI